MMPYVFQGLINLSWNYFYLIYRDSEFSDISENYKYLENIQYYHII